MTAEELIANLMARNRKDWAAEVFVLLPDGDTLGIESVMGGDTVVLVAKES